MFVKLSYVCAKKVKSWNGAWIEIVLRNESSCSTLVISSKNPHNVRISRTWVTIKLTISSFIWTSYSTKTEKKSHSPNKLNLTWDVDGSTDELQSLPEGGIINWSAITQKNNATQNNYRGQILKTIAERQGNGANWTDKRLRNIHGGIKSDY